VVGRLTQYMRSRLNSRDIEWVNLQMPAALDRAGHLRAAAQLRRVIAGQETQLVHSHGLSAHVVASLAARRLRPRPALICSLTESLSPEIGAKPVPWRLRRLRAWSLGQAQAVVVGSRSEADAVAEAMPRLRGRTAVIHQGVEPRRWTSASDPGRRRSGLGLDTSAAIVGLVSPLRMGLGIEDFLRAAAQVIRSLPSVEFVIIGDGPQRELLEGLAHSLGVRGAVIFLGERVDAADIVSILNLLVLTSDAAAGPLRALQALAADVAVVAADTGGLREVLESLPRTCIYPPGDTEALAAAICEHLEIVPPETAAELVADGATGLSLSREDLLASDAAYNMDTPGLDPERPQTGEALTAAEAVSRRFTVEAMIGQLGELYDGLVGEGSR